MNLRAYLNQGGRGTASALARAVHVHAVLISQWSADRPVPLEHCTAIEQATGGDVRRWDLRPDDWHRIWPELIGLPGAPSLQHDIPALQQRDCRDVA